ncbi:hypothetical protein [Serratia fonticola]
MTDFTNYKNILCLDDLLRDEFWPAKEFFYDLIREQILQSSGINIKQSPRLDHDSNLLPGFESARFKKLAGNEHTSWITNFNKLNQLAKNYLVNYIPRESLVLSYEMPPWLCDILSEKQIDFIDIRISPIRFGKDLFIALKSNSDRINDIITRYSVKENSIRLDASLMKASARHLERYNNNSIIDDNSLIYIGQTETDASLISNSGDIVRLSNYIHKIIELAKNHKKIYYQAHPAAGEFAVQEQKSLINHIGIDIERCYTPTYELLCSDKNLTFVGISSGVLQEAYYFDRKAYVLFKNICPLSGENCYIQINFIDYLSPNLWSEILNTTLISDSINDIPENYLRRLHDVWWGYSTYLYQGRHLSKEIFGHGGGYKMQTTLDTLINSLNASPKDASMHGLSNFENWLKSLGVEYDLSKDAHGVYNDSRVRWKYNDWRLKNR